ncbi:hypothetical protein [Chitinophaga cymbidii]|uniref:Phage P1-related protein n=1 Tax=Chitinophaga cymbidii TaxID=1096750 RepID=A0A512RF87_9BACT|nr:hypothetical protein [Chitinophaga cymbidii]GEP94361.1 hypothetical protein CCY01nite_06210 [Chitinophaga cymbidii]
MALDNLEVLFDDLGLMPTEEQLQEMLGCFMDDFVHSPFKIKDCNVKVIMEQSWHKNFRGMPETFVHLITRESKYTGRREFDHERANRIHWVKQILVNHTSPKVKYFEYADEKGVLKYHFWYEEGSFIVILKPVQPDLLVVTAFCIDEFEKQRYRKRYNAFRR